MKDVRLSTKAIGEKHGLVDLIERERLRTRIEGAVMRLIDALDAIDAPATDLEDGDDAEAVNEDCCEMGGTDNGIADAEGFSRPRETAHA